MAWYSDEQYEMIKDSREKKSIAASSYKQRTHCGKGGAVKFPSDYLSAKELKAMNGECIKYASLKQPMNWEEFKKLPDDLKIEYVKSLRKKFNVPDAELATMFGVNKNIVYRHFKCYGLGKGVGSGAKVKTWNRDGWLLWLHGVEPDAVTPSETPVTEEVVEEDTPVAVNEDTDIVVNEETVDPADEAAVEEILAFIGEVAAEVQKDLYPEDAKEEPKSEEKVPEQKGTDVQKHVDNYFRNEAVKEGYSVTNPEPDVGPGPIAFTGHFMPVIPKKGNMSFEYNYADDALATIKCLLSNAKVNLTISWECVF